MSKQPKKPVVLIIRDGWGVNPGGPKTAKQDGNATELGQTPFHDQILQQYPKGLISASGEDVGLPAGQMGNSEVGHLNLGAGRIVYQDLTRINKAISSGELSKNLVLKDAFRKAKNSKLHLIGLVSDGGVHSHLDHLIALAKEAHQGGVNDIRVHAFTDGRDTSPTGGKDYLAKLEESIAPYQAHIVTVIGRYYAMDRDQRWERTKLAWDAIVHGQGQSTLLCASEATEEQYREGGKTDEFLQPMTFGQNLGVHDGDVVLFFNFRADRARQLSEAFLHEHFDGFDRGPNPPKVHYLTLTEYDNTYQCPVAFPPENMSQVLGEVVAHAGLQQLRIAETEKYPHVTYFFNGGVEVAYPGEHREIVPSPKDCATYDEQPEMSAEGVTQLVEQLLPEHDLIILNFANPDMVGHTGVVDAAIQAVEKIDDGVRRVVEKTLSLGGKLLITADHGNCEYMKNPDGSPHTAHTTNLVHAIYVAEDADQYQVQNGILADIAPTLLDMLGLDQPTEMTGKSLLQPR